MYPKQSLEELIDASSLTRLLYRVVLLCAFVAMIDGFDTQCIALVAPEIAANWHVPATKFGLIFGAGLLGGLFGALGFGAIADRRGRKPALLGAVCLLAVATLVTPLCQSLPELAAARLITGLGLGGALPAIVSLTSEYAPMRLRATLVTVMFCGFPLGAVLGGLVSSRMIPIYGWKSIFLLGSITPLVLIPFLALYIPESARFLAQRSPERLLRLFDELGWAGRWNGEVALSDNKSPAAVRGLFVSGMARTTLLLWATLFCSLLLAYFLVNWMPMLARTSGIGIKGAVLGTASLNMGGILGCLVIGWMVDRSRSTVVVGVAFLLGGVAVACLGLIADSAARLVVIAFFAGAFTLGPQMCAVALCPSFYRTEIRATGVAWSMAAGRCGAICGPVIGGGLLAMGFSAPVLFLIAGGVSVAAACVIVGLRLVPKPSIALPQ